MRAVMTGDVAQEGDGDGEMLSRALSKNGRRSEGKERLTLRN